MLKKSVLLITLVLVATLGITTLAFSSMGIELDRIALTPTQSVTSTPHIPPGTTPSATPVDTDLLPIIFKVYISPTPGPSLTPTVYVTSTPIVPPGPSSTPTVTPVDADYLPVVIRPYMSPTPGPSPTFEIPVTSTSRPPPGG
ncbi:MAG: hypothetical protein KDE48_24345 [Anaerolineales bacterium]|nr:hypothetical protein [Anaerolineales bacterium]